MSDLKDVGYMRKVLYSSSRGQVKGACQSNSSGWLAYWDGHMVDENRGAMVWHLQVLGSLVDMKWVQVLLVQVNLELSRGHLMGLERG